MTIKYADGPSPEGEPVQPEFAWQPCSHTAAPAVSDCVCSPELVSTLVDLLYTRSRQVEAPRKRFTT